MIIDAHQHFWKRDLPFDYQWLNAPGHEAINRDFLPRDLEPELRQAGVDYSIFVQTQHDMDETRWGLELARGSDWIAGVVGWVDLASPNVEQALQELTQDPFLVGFRHITQDEPDDNFIVRDDVLRGLGVLERHQVPFDLLFYDRHLHHAATVARACPELNLVIDHLAKPPIRIGELSRWASDMQAAAACPNVCCKLSGLITEADWQSWKPADIRPYVNTALEMFGPQRCMFGSDWPVCELAGTYQEVWDLLNQLIDDLSESDRQAILFDTANRFYGLSLNSESDPVT